MLLRAAEDGAESAQSGRSRDGGPGIDPLDDAFQVVKDKLHETFDIRGLFRVLDIKLEGMEDDLSRGLDRLGLAAEMELPSNPTRRVTGSMPPRKRRSPTWPRIHRRSAATWAKKRCRYAFATAIPSTGASRSSTSWPQSPRTRAASSTALAHSGSTGDPIASSDG